MAWLFRMSVGYERKQEAEEKKGHCLQALRKHTQERRELSLRYDFLHVLKSGVPLQLEELLCPTAWGGGNLAGRIQIRQLSHTDAQKPHHKILQGGGIYQTEISADHLFPRKTHTVIFFTDLFLQNWHYLCSNRWEPHQWLYIQCAIKVMNRGLEDISLTSIASLT